MTSIYLTECNTKSYGVTFQMNGWIKGQKIEVISDDEKNIYCVKPLETISGKSESCMITAMSGAFDKPVFHGNTIFFK